MGYELRTGWRYLHGGHRDLVMRRFALISLAICAAGVIAIATGADGIGALALITGMIATALFALLSVLSIFTAMSTLGVALGVSALVVVLAVTTGFQREFRDRILGVNAHVIVRNHTGVSDLDHVMQVARAHDEVVAVGPFSYDEALVTRGLGTSTGVAIKGIEPAAARAVLDLDQYIVDGTLDALERPPHPGELPAIILGRGIADKLDAKVGGNVKIVIPLLEGNYQPRTREFRVVAIFNSGFDEYDRHLAFAALREMRPPGERDRLTGVEVALRDVDRAADVAAELQADLGAPYEVVGWRQLNSNLFQALDAQKVVLVLILTLIILVAAVNMVSALMMMVTDKTGEIAILKSMGSSTRGISRVFRTVGIAIGSIGTAIGIAVGLVTCYVVEGYGFRLDSKLYMIDRLPLEIRPLEVALVGAIALVISAVATWVPARTAAALTPVEGLRYE